MPSLDWNVRGPIYVADVKAQEYLLVNRDSGAWAVSDLAGVAALQVDATPDNAALPDPLRRLLHPLAAPPAPVRVEPLILIYKLTDKCNYHCSYCYDRSVARPKNGERRSAAVRNLLDRTLPERPVMLLFHGGEPLLEFNEIRELVLAYEQFTPSRLLFSLQTNLSRMDQAKLDFFLEHQFGISVSLDGHNPGLNRLRMVDQRPDPYQVLMGKLRNLKGLRADRLGLLMTVGKHNVGSLVESLLAFQADGFRSVSFSFMQDVEPGTSCATPEELTAAMLAITGAIADRRIEALACMTLIQWIMRITRGRTGLVCLGSPCGAGRSVATILADGDIGPCDSIFSQEFFHQDVDSYLQNLETDPYLRALRERSVRNLFPCSSWDVRAHCNGTCPGSAVLENGTVQSVDPHECAFYYGLIRELLWMLCEPEAGPRIMEYCHRHLAEKKAYGF